jgi:hypothetical protein
MHGGTDNSGTTPDGQRPRDRRDCRRRFRPGLAASLVVLGVLVAALIRVVQPLSLTPPTPFTGGPALSISEWSPDVFSLCRPLDSNRGRIPPGAFLIDPEPVLNGEVSLLWTQTDVGVLVNGRALQAAACRSGYAQVTSCRLRRAATWMSWFPAGKTSLPAGFPLDRAFDLNRWAYTETPLGSGGWTAARNLDCSPAPVVRQPAIGELVPICGSLSGAALVGHDQLYVGLIRAPAAVQVDGFEWGADGSWTVDLKVAGEAVLVAGRPVHVVVQTMMGALQRAGCRNQGGVASQKS